LVTERSGVLLTKLSVYSNHHHHPVVLTPQWPSIQYAHLANSSQKTGMLALRGRGVGCREGTPKRYIQSSGILALR
jgi:hypothetical protein